jgi:hypothetical protein
MTFLGDLEQASMAGTLGEENVFTSRILAVLCAGGWHVRVVPAEDFFVELLGTGEIENGDLGPGDCTWL